MRTAVGTLLRVVWKSSSMARLSQVRPSATSPGFLEESWGVHLPLSVEVTVVLSCAFCH